MTRDDAVALATRNGHTMGPWRDLFGSSGLESCVCECGMWIADVGGDVGGNALTWTHAGLCVGRPDPRRTPATVALDGEA